MREAMNGEQTPGGVSPKRVFSRNWGVTGWGA